MSFELRAASMSKDDVVALLRDHDQLRRAHIELEQSHDDLARQVAWFKRQLFGSKSERRMIEPSGRQLTLGEMFRAGSDPILVPVIEVPAHQRRAGQSRDTGSLDEVLRFDPSVPVEVIEVENPELRGVDLSDYERIGEKVTERLAQRPGSYVVLRFVRPVYRRKEDGVFSCPPAPAAVFDRSLADVSLLAGILIDKFTYHLPLYRQHQRLAAAGVHLARSTLTGWVHRVGDLLEPIYEAQLRSILSSQVLAMDETPIKAGRKEHAPTERGGMKTAYFWPIYGDQDEIAFPFAATRGSAVVRAALKEYVGVLLSDGYEVYDRYTRTVDRIEHAQCWSHTRRHFEHAEASEPRKVRDALDTIAALYREEEFSRSKRYEPEHVLAHRGERSKPIVDRFFEDLRRAMAEEILLPTNPFTKAANYALERERSLRVFLANPAVPLDTNHLERAIRPIAVGRRNWLFCWTEVGAKYVGIIQSLLSTCRVQGVDPYAYLVDVLQRIDTHPASDVVALTPRVWKNQFAAAPLRSCLDRNHRPAVG